MSRLVRDASGVLMLLVSVGALGGGLVFLRGRDYLAAVLLIVAGLSLVRAATELLRPSAGE